MQHTVRNRATIRVADRTDLSGTVTADKVNLDGFHSPIRKLRVIARTWLALVTVSLGLYLGLPVCGLAQNNQGSGIKLVVPKGTYSFRDSGYLLPAYPSLQPLVPLEAAGRITYVPTGPLGGTTSGVLWASIGGQISPITVKGSFTVNPDGSVTEIEQQTGGPGALLHFADYPTPDGNTMTFVATETGSIVSGISTRGSPAGDEQ